MSGSPNDDSSQIPLDTKYDSFLEEREFSNLVSDLQSSKFLSQVNQEDGTASTGRKQRDEIWDKPQKMILHNSSIDGFHLLCELARGELGRIFLGKHKKFAHNIAIRLIPISDKNQPASKQAILSPPRVQHKSLVPVLQTGIASDFFYQATKFVSGANYKEIIREGRVFSHSCLNELLTVCRGVEQAHKNGHVHLGIEPASLHRDHKGKAHLSGWGLAPFFRLRAFGKSISTRIDRNRYTAPELTESEPLNEKLCDVFSIGGVLYDLIAESKPFASSIGGRIAGTPFSWPISIREDLPSQDALQLVCQKCLSQNPADRYQDMASLCEDLSDLIEGKPISLQTNQSWLSKLGSWLKVPNT